MESHSPSSDRILTLFPDTNFFIQCHPAKTLDWTSLGAWDEIRLLVCRAVQREIDQLKGRGKERVGKRTREASTLLRPLVRDQPVVLRDKSPRVFMLLDSTRPYALFNQQLDYDRADDQIVGTVAAFSFSHPSAKVYLLTHDIGPMASAKDVGVSFIEIPDSWLLPTENTEQEKRISALESELSHLRNAGPVVKVNCIDRKRSPIERVDIERILYSPLTDEQVSAFVDRIKGELPVHTFGESDTEMVLRRAVTTLSGQIFIPPTATDIAGYQEEYQAWLKSCETALREWHELANRNAAYPVLSFAVENVGAQPAKDALFSFQAKGRFTLARVAKKPTRRRSKWEKQENVQRLPLPPAAPIGRVRDYTTALQMPMPDLSYMGTLRGVLAASPAGVLPDVISPLARDANAFYWKAGADRNPSTTVELECEQWRHGVGAKIIELALHPDDAPDVSGVVTCSIHAENMPDPVTASFPVRITTRHESVENEAAKGVDDLINRSRS